MPGKAVDLDKGIAIANHILRMVEEDQYFDLDGLAIDFDLGRGEQPIAWLLAASISVLADMREDSIRRLLRVVELEQRITTIQADANRALAGYRAAREIDEAAIQCATCALREASETTPYTRPEPTSLPGPGEGT